MDNLTHTLTGLMLSRAGLGRFHPRAALLLALAANVPDVDAVSLLGGAGAYFEHHRALTHALVAIPVVALLPVVLVRLLDRRQPFDWKSAWLISMAGVVSHLLLDATNAYGIRLYLPWNNAWPSLSITGVIDVWIWTILLLGTFAPLLGRLVSNEIGSKTTSTGRGWAITALLFIFAYDSARAVLHARAVQLQESRLYNGESPRRVLAYPSMVNPLVWDGVVETGAFFLTQTVNLARGGVQTTGSRIWYKPEFSHRIAAATHTRAFRLLADFSRALVWRTTPAPDGEDTARVEAYDLYFGFTATAIVDDANRVQRTAFRFSR